ERQRGAKPPPFEDVFPAVVEIHEEVAGMLCQTWKLPAEVSLVVAHHHSCTIDGQVHPLTAAIAIAEALAADAGFGMEIDAQPTLPEVVVRALRITDKTLAVIRAESIPVLKRIQ